MIEGASLRETGSREPSPSSTGLGPSGFDPARFAILSRTIAAKEAVGVSYTSKAEHIDALLDTITPYAMRGMVEHTLIPRHSVLSGKDWFQRTIDLADNQPWVRETSRLAIAMEARQGGDVKQAPSAQADDSAGR